MPTCIVITGASSGMGAALAHHYAKSGVTLGLIGRNAERLQAVQAFCENQGARVMTGQLDITETAQLQHWLHDFDQQNPVDLLIVNAGISHSIRPHTHTEQDIKKAGVNGETHRDKNRDTEQTIKQNTAENPPEESLQAIHHLLNTNLQAAIDTLQALLPAMRKRGQGQIALVSSLAAYRGMPITPAYCASKAALKAYGEALRGGLAPEGIKINVICPGFVKSSMSDQFPAPKPFMISAERAAYLVAKGLARNKAIISFPFPLNLGMWLLAVLPFPIASFFLGLSGYNQPRTRHQRS